jgi:hypothetical protein
VLAVLSTIVGVLYRAVHSALLPSLCRTAVELTGANVVRGLVDSVSTMLGDAWVFAAAALASLWSAAVTARVTAEVATTTGHRSAGAKVGLGVWQGLRAVRASGPLLRLFTLAAVQTFLRGALTVFVVVVAIDLVGMGSPGVGTLTGAVGAGAVVGSVAASALVGTHRLARWFGVGVVLWGLPIALVGVLPYQPAALALLAVVGVGNALVDVGLFTLIARLVPGDVLGRVYGALESVIALSVAGGSLAAPLAIDAVGLRRALVVIGLVGPLAVGVVWRTLRRLDATMGGRDRDVALLRTVPMLAPLPLPAVEELARALTPLRVRAGTAVFVQGEPGDRCYVVEEGVAEVVGDGRAVAELGPGDLFGEIALLHRVPRTATVRARTDLLLQALTSERFLPVVTGYRSSAAAAAGDVAARLAHFAPDPPSGA